MQKMPPGINRRRLVEAAAATAAVSTLGLPSLVLAEESSSMSAVAQPNGSEKTAIHPFGVQGQDRLQSSKVKSQCAGADVIHPAVEISPSDIVTRFARAVNQREVRNERIVGLICLKSTVCDPQFGARRQYDCATLAPACAFSVRTVPARAALYARPGPEMAREARARRRAATAHLVVWARTRFMRVAC
jgi:hypothetical protein